MIPQTVPVNASRMPTFIEPMLTLSYHQKSKHETISKECSTLAHYFQLDFLKKDKERQELASSAIPVLQKKGSRWTAGHIAICSICFSRRAYTTNLGKLCGKINRVANSNSDLCG